MASGFHSEKHCREETIGRAVGIVEASRRERRKLTNQEAARIDGLLTMAEVVLGIGSIPREPEALLNYARKPDRSGRNRMRAAIQ
jgi:hypothetical protein